jgi:hypothetical protein
MDNFEKLYKNWVDRYQPEPPSEIWEGIEEELDISEAWEGVQDELDVMNSWRVIEKRLDAQKRRRFLAIASVAASLLFLISLGVWQVYDGLSGNNDTDLITAANEHVTKQVEMQLPENPADFQLVQSASAQIDLAQIKKEANAIRQLMPERDNLFGAEHRYKMPYLAQIPHGSVVQGTIPYAHLADIAQEDKTEAVRSVNEEKEKSRTYSWQNSSYGVYASLSNTWVMNNKTISGLRADELVRTQASYGKDIGVFYMQPLSVSTALRLEYLFYSQANQNYNEYYNGKYVASNISMRYQQFNLLFHWQPGEQNHRHTIYAGGYGGYLFQATQRIGDEEESLLREYSRLDYGFVGGYWYQLPAFEQRIPLAIGVRFKYGMPNVFQGNESIPADFSSTRNLAFQVTFSVGLDKINF